MVADHNDIYEQDLQERAFKALGFTTRTELIAQFGWFVEAFQYGTPPHGRICIRFRSS
ncbi:MAG: amino acid--tRNA ligase-related protein [Thomasclavelia sp.]